MSKEKAKKHLETIGKAGDLMKFPMSGVMVELSAKATLRIGCEDVCKEGCF